MEGLTYCTTTPKDMQSKIWVENGKQNDKYKVENIMAKRTLRKQRRKEQFLERNKFYSDVMHNPGTVVFHKLINRNRPNRHSDTACITEQTTNHYTTEDQTKCFARYYGDLTVPKDKGYDTASLEHRNVRHTLMEDICEEEAKTHTQVITSEMIQNAVESLNTGKAADEHGLKAEHFKNSPHAIYIFLEMCFKRILNDSITPDTFKTGILTPVLKKAKNPMIMDNYRGITVIPTSVYVPCKRNSY